MAVISNIIIPGITGIFFFIYFLYFVIANQSRAASFFYFIVFLLSFSLFLIGRPLQLLLGTHPVQLITVNIRMIIFCFFSITSITAAMNLFSSRSSPRSRHLVFGLGVLFGLTYVIFNTLGTTGSVSVFRWGSITAYDTLTPTGRGPFYGREVTIAVQVAIGFLLFLSALVNLVRSNRTDRRHLPRIRDKVFLFNSGVLLFGLTFMVGSFTKQWWIYYFFSMFCALLFGAGVVLDIRELHNNYERLIPFIKEDILQNVALNNHSMARLRELLSCLGKEESLDTFAVVALMDRGEDPDFRESTKRSITLMDRIGKVISEELEQRAGIRNFLMIPLDGRRVGVALNLQGNETVRNIHGVSLMEKLQSSIRSRSSLDTAVGIGRSYAKLEDLSTSYYEALSALEYAEKMGKGSLIHVNDIIPEEDGQARFPAREKIRLLTALKGGDRVSSRQALEEFLGEFRKFVIRKPEVLKLRLFELSGALVDSGIMGGGNEELLNGLIGTCLEDIEGLTSFQKAEVWLKDLTERILDIITRTQKSRTALIIDRGKEIIAHRYAEQIGYKDIARELNISSSYFLALFKQETGSTFVEYLTELRIARSKELLLNSQMTITEISFEVGINNPNYFSSLFRKSSGVSAKEFRRLNGTGVPIRNI